MKIIELGNREDLGNLDGSCDWKIETEKGNFTLKATNSFSEVAESDQYSKESKLKDIIIPEKFKKILKKMNNYNEEAYYYILKSFE